MKATKVLFATDFSPASMPALELASSMASDTGATLIIAYVDVEKAYPIGDGAYGMALDAPEFHKESEEKRRRLQEIKPTVPGVDYTHRYLEGMPAEEIIGLANKQEVDWIVVGSHGRTGLARMLMGSVAEAIVRHAECPVAVVKHHAL